MENPNAQSMQFENRADFVIRFGTGTSNEELVMTNIVPCGIGSRTVNWDIPIEQSEQPIPETTLHSEQPDHGPDKLETIGEVLEYILEHLTTPKTNASAVISSDETGNDDTYRPSDNVPVDDTTNVFIGANNDPKNDTVMVLQTEGPESSNVPSSTSSSNMIKSRRKIKGVIRHMDKGKSLMYSNYKTTLSYEQWKMDRLPCSNEKSQRQGLSEVLEGSGKANKNTSNGLPSSPEVNQVEQSSSNQQESNTTCFKKTPIVSQYWLRSKIAIDNMYKETRVRRRRRSSTPLQPKKIRLRPKSNGPDEVQMELETMVIADTDVELRELHS